MSIKNQNQSRKTSQTRELVGVDVPRLVMLCDDGEQVHDGDEITFSYGIPPVRVCAQVEAFEGELWALTHGHNPSRCRLSELREHVELFYKA